MTLRERLAVKVEQEDADAALLTLSCTPSPTGIADAQPRIRTFLEAHAVPERVIARADVLFEEIVMNISMHGFEDPDGEIVNITVQRRKDAIEIVFEDHGRAFDPVAAEPRASDETFDEDRPGGLGLVLLQRMASSVSYSRLPAGINQLRVTMNTDESGRP